MRRNIVICSDGTGNTFDKGVSNVTRLIHLLRLDNRHRQIAVYDQGIGTNGKRLDAVRKFRDSILDKKSLRILPGPKEWWFEPLGWPVLVFGLVGGCGLRSNVREIYRELSELYMGPADHLFLFGFSRGAFTVRALAGMIYRCGLPRTDVDFDRFFDEAWELYQPHCQDKSAVANLRRKYSRPQDCEIAFMGLWDTVKSYGTLRPISLPHLRHNPIVRTVRHAIAIDEHRTWFNATTWGQLDLDEDGAKKRLKEKDRPSYESQNICEIWFRGCHSDVGGGDTEEETARIPLRWMLKEAYAAGLVLSDSGRAEMRVSDARGAPMIHESSNWMWRLLDWIPRLEINNSKLYPIRELKVKPTGKRKPGDLTRGRNVSYYPYSTES